MPNIDNIIKQLKSRKVFRSLAIYAGFAFVLLQVCDIVIPRLFLPEWTMTFIIVLVIIGFPIIAVLSWIYDITPSEDEETPSTEIKQPLGLYTLTGLILTVIGITFWVSVGILGVTFGSNEEIPSIAIIPFDNKGAEEDEFYAYSISSEVISDVTSAGLIRVASQRNIERLDYQTLNNEELSEKLLVRYIAQGTLWKADNIFQLSIELYDTKTSKVLWSESWQKTWNELASIKANIADNILKTLKVSTKQDFAKVHIPNANAYEYYLKAKYKYEKRDDMEDIEITRGLLEKAIELDDELFNARYLLGLTYYDTGNYILASKIYLEILSSLGKQGNSIINAYLYDALGVVFETQGEYNRALDYYNSSLEIAEGLNLINQMSVTLSNLGILYSRKGELKQALYYYNRSYKIAEEIQDTLGMASLYNEFGILYDQLGAYDTSIDYYKKIIDLANQNNYNKEELHDMFDNIGNAYAAKGEYEIAMEYLIKSLEIRKRINYNHGIAYSLHNIGSIYFFKGEFHKAIEFLDESLIIQKEIGLDERELLETSVILFLCYKNIFQNYDVNELHRLISKTEYIEDYYNYLFYQLLEDTSYLETAYNQVQEKADNLEPDVAAKFLSYPIPKAIVEEWEKVK